MCAVGLPLTDNAYSHFVLFLYFVT